ncbi:MAG: hypothetical protein AVDCRST_MAG70-330 [uncultured Thermomicrobiales bacterium]|uniref:D-ribose pyranase n=1 Tax=uncultured Thermomicrobiales bacterium TaxID=1645740 RepID=A0A6J4UC92_9BACT|nr:MAG: hypothetical protein AVDCRST_MAG70-330 [uncultured Thermomicrobiales bacterium]
MTGAVREWDYHRETPGDDLAARLASLGAEGWELVSTLEGHLVFKRPATTLRERVTLDQRRSVFRHFGQPLPSDEPTDGIDQASSPGLDRDDPIAAEGILHPGVLHLLASTGHTDSFTICDAGFPVPIGPERIELAWVAGQPTVLAVLGPIMTQFGVDRVLIAAEAEAISPAFVADLRAMLGQTPVEVVSHLQLKRLGHEGRATIRTGDTTPYANLVVIAG